MPNESKHKDILEGKTLETILTELVEIYGWEQMGNELKIRVFLNKPTINSSLKMLRRTPWARKALEDLYRAHVESSES